MQTVVRIISVRMSEHERTRTKRGRQTKTKTESCRAREAKRIMRSDGVYLIYTISLKLIEWHALKYTI